MGNVDESIALQLQIDLNDPEALDQVKAKIEELNANLGKATQTAQEFNDTQKQLSQAKELYKQLTAETAKNTSEVEKGVQAYNDFRHETMSGIGNLSKLKEGTIEYQAELRKAAALKSEFRELQKEIRLSDPKELVKNLAGFGRMGTEAFRGIGAAAAFATGNNDEFIQTLFKVEAATEAINGAIALEEIWRHRAAIATEIQTAAQAALNLITNQWPILLLVSGIAALVGWIVSLSGSTEDMKKKQEELKKAQEDLNESMKRGEEAVKHLRESEIAYLESVGAPLEEIHRKKRELMDDDFRATKAALNHAIGVEEAAHRELLATATLVNGVFTYDEKAKKIYEKTKADVEAARATFDAAFKDIQTFEAKYDSENKKREQDDEDKRIQKEKERRAEITKAQEEQFAQAMKEYNMKQAFLLKYQQEQEKAIKDDNEKRILLMKGTGATEYDILMAQELEEIRLSDQSELAKLKIMQKYDSLREALDKQAADKSIKTAQEAAKKKEDIQKSEWSTAKSYGDALVSLGDIFAKEGEKQTDLQKGLALAKIAIDTAKAISSLTAASQENPANGVTFGAAGAAQFAAGIAQILANIASAKKILDGGGSTSSISASGNTGTPSYTPNITSTQFGNQPKYDSQGRGDYGYDSTIKTYVTQTDLNAAQAKAYYQNLNRRAR